MGAALKEQLEAVTGERIAALIAIWMRRQCAWEG